ncbi:MAG: response regulator receiver domain, partial [Candidatus Tectomicrobia bacterium]|nr:response regulator receiver domain [Candidatus Tectomicrobia bacterium]
MTADNGSFENDRLEAAGLFAHTMIVVDDEASQGESEHLTKQESEVITPPRRGAARAAADKQDEENLDIKHALDAKVLIDNAMELGLICSVLRPEKGEDLKERVRKAAERADIVCLDWEIYGDDGETAKALITEIVRSDSERHGRLRLIAIYTGERDKQGILNNVLSIFSESERQNRNIKKHQDAEIVTSDGLRIVYLFKKHGTRLPHELLHYQVSEEELPARLLREFARLSEGLLSNVALATIASVRNVAHHVVQKFNSRMDGPYFHHRATLTTPDDAEDYAVEIVLSELKSAIDKQLVARRYAGSEAIEARIRNIAGDRSQLHLSYEDKGEIKHCDLNIDDVVKLIVDGCKDAHDNLTVSNKPSKARIRESVSSLFGSKPDDTKANMREFASLTGIRAHPGNYLFGSGNYRPVLGLGSVVQDKAKQYWICLQASCDSVRLDENTAFLFAPLFKVKTKPEIVTPDPDEAGRGKFLPLKLEDTAYAKTISVMFLPDEGTRTV